MLLSLSLYNSSNEDFRGPNSLPGTDVMIFEIFSPKKSARKLAFLAQNKFGKILIITSVFEKNAIFSPKIVKTRRKL
jgi:hypothetical protein